MTKIRENRRISRKKKPVCRVNKLHKNRETEMRRKNNKIILDKTEKYFMIIRKTIKLFKIIDIIQLNKYIYSHSAMLQHKKSVIDIR